MGRKKQMKGNSEEGELNTFLKKLGVTYQQVLVLNKALEKDSGIAFVSSSFSPEVHALMRKVLIKKTKLEHGYYRVELTAKGRSVASKWRKWRYEPK